MWWPPDSEPKFSVQGDWWGCHPSGSRLGPLVYRQVLGDGERVLSLRAGTAPNAAWEGPGHMGSHSLPSEGQPVYPFVSGPESQGGALDLAASLALGFWDLVSLCFHCLGGGLSSLSWLLGFLPAPSQPPNAGSQVSLGLLCALLIRSIKRGPEKNKKFTGQPLIPFLPAVCCVGNAGTQTPPARAGVQAVPGEGRIWRGVNARCPAATQALPHHSSDTSYSTSGPLHGCLLCQDTLSPSPLQGSIPCPFALPDLLVQHPPPQFC